MPTGPKKQADARRARAESQEENFLRRWSRRKDAAPPVRAAAPMPERDATRAPVLTDRDMPPLASLNEQSDFSGFLSRGVSEALRRRALRKLFQLPQFNERCPLDSEYYDCANFTPLGDTVTHEMREALEREARRLGAAARRNVLDDASAQPPSARDEARSAATPAAVAAPARRRQPSRTRSAAKRRRGHSRS